MRSQRHFVDITDPSPASHPFEHFNSFALHLGNFQIQVRIGRHRVGASLSGGRMSSLPRHGRTAFLMLVKRIGRWCRGTELNRRRQPFQGCALPPELPRHAGNSVRLALCAMLVSRSNGRKTLLTIILRRICFSVKKSDCWVVKQFEFSAMSRFESPIR